MSFDEVRQIAVSLPDVKESITGWGWAFKLHGKLLACQAIHRSAERDSLVVRVGLDDRARLLAAEPDKFYVTAHYAPYPSVLVRVPKVNRADMRSVLQVAWSFVTADPAPVRHAAGKKKTSPNRLRKRLL
ncbi:MAG: MmcQ/YjbR family DNA-binding protein [Steroidobacteraceae bacterium]